jgi:hypothetical protein
VATHTRICGWAWNAADPATKLMLDVFDNGVRIGRVAADRFRGDLEDAGIDDGRHSFGLDVALSPLTHHAIVVRFVGGGEALDNAPLLVVPTQPFDDGLAHALAAALDGTDEPGQALDFLGAQMERLLQRRADAESQRDDRAARLQACRRWGTDPGEPVPRALVIAESAPPPAEMHALRQRGYAVSTVNARDFGAEQDHPGIAHCRRHSTPRSRRCCASTRSRCPARPSRGPTAPWPAIIAPAPTSSALPPLPPPPPPPRGGGRPTRRHRLLVSRCSNLRLGIGRTSSAKKRVGALPTPASRSSPGFTPGQQRRRSRSCRRDRVFFSTARPPAASAQRRNRSRTEATGRASSSSSTRSASASRSDPQSLAELMRTSSDLALATRPWSGAVEMERNDVKLVLMVSLACLSFAVAAQAAAPSNLVGTWTTTGESARAKIGAARKGWSAAGNDPDLTFSFHPSVVIEKQEGRSLAGYKTQPDGSKDYFVGVFKHGGREIVLRTSEGMATADIVGNDIEFCWVSDVPDLYSAQCDMLRRTQVKP